MKIIWEVIAQPSARLREEPAALEGRAEKHLDTADLAAFERDELGAAKAPAICCQTAIGDEGLVAGVNEFITSTAAVVEEQSIVTSDMSANMQRSSAKPS